MQRRRALRVATWVAACGVLVIGSVASADERTDARREFRSGMQAIAEGRFDDGVELLERAYDILPHPNVLYNIGLAHMYAGRSEQALQYFERYRETAPASDALEVDSLIKSLRQAKPSEPGPSGAVAAPAVGTPASEVSASDTLSTLEAAAREVRRLAEAQNDAALKKQADELDRAVAKLRSEQRTAADTPQSAAGPATAPASARAGRPAKQEAKAAVYEERVVSASRLSQSPLDAPNATAIITSQTIRMSGVTQLSALLRRVAGVEVATVAPYHAEISIRGLNKRSSNKVLLLWDGRPVRKDFIGTNWIDMVPILVDDIERIEIIRGPASALYGADAFAGVINIITRAPGEGGSLAVSRVGNDGQIQGGVSFSGRASEKVAYRASVLYTQANNSVQVVGNDRVDVARPNQERARSYNAVSANSDIAYTYAKGGVASVGANYTGSDATLQGLSRLNQTVSDPAYETQAYGTLTTPIGIRLAGNYDDVVGHPRPAYIAPNSVSSQRSYIKQQLFDLDLSYSGSFTLLIKQTLTIGATYRYKNIDWTWLDGVHTQHHEGAYLQNVMQLAKPLKLQVGARIDHHPLLSSLQFSPRASLVYRFLGEQSLRLSGGRAFRGPSFLESYLLLPNDTPLRGVTAWGKGNDKLSPESITSVELGYQNQQSDYFTLEANVYYNVVKNLILFTDNDAFTLSDFAGGNPLATYNRSAQAFPVSALSFANERAKYGQLGGELGARFFPVEGLDVYCNYAINSTKPTQKAKVDPVRANEQQTSLHKVNSGVQYRSFFGLEGSVDVSWSSPQKWVEQVTDVTTGVRWQQYDQPAFVMLSARLGYRLFGDRLELGVVGTNLLNNSKRQQPISQPLDRRVLGSAKVRF